MATTKLNPFDEYQKVIDALFGAGVVRINPSVVSNNAIGTWRHADEFEMFKNNYTNKLQRLKDLYAGTKECGIIQNLAASIADEKNWEGAYAELVAYDILNTDYNAPLKLDNTRKASFAIAGKMGMKNINYDIYICQIMECIWTSRLLLIQSVTSLIIVSFNMCFEALNLHHTA